MMEFVYFNKGRKGDTIGRSLPSGKLLFPKGFSPSEGDVSICLTEYPAGKTGFAYPAHAQPERVSEIMAEVRAGRPPYALVADTIYLPHAEATTRKVRIRVEWFGKIGIGQVVADPLAEVEALRKRALEIERTVQDTAALVRARFFHQSVAAAQRSGELAIHIEETVGNAPIDRSADEFDRAPTGRWRPFVTRREVVDVGEELYQKLLHDAERVRRRYLRSQSVRGKLAQAEALRKSAAKAEEEAI